MKKILVYCENCKCEFKKFYSQVQLRPHHFCSHKCYSEWLSLQMNGHKHSPETIEKISNSLNGHKHSFEAIEKNRIAHLGENNHNWKGGKSFESYGGLFNKKLKEEIRNKFDRTCFLSGEKENGRKLDVHHINYNKKDNRIWNLIPLTQRYHLKTNGSRWFWFNLLKNYWVFKYNDFNIIPLQHTFFL